MEDMRFLRIGHNFYEVEDEKLDESRAAYHLKCKSALSDVEPEFTWNNEDFYLISMVSYKQAIEIDLEEYKNEVEYYTNIVWRLVSYKSVVGNGGAFVLLPREKSSRKAFKRHITTIDFDELVHKMHKEEIERSAIMKKEDV